MTDAERFTDLETIFDGLCNSVLIELRECTTLDLLRERIDLHLDMAQLQAAAIPAQRTTPAPRRGA